MVVNHILARVYGVSWGKGEGRPDSETKDIHKSSLACVIGADFARAQEEISRTRAV